MSVSKKNIWILEDDASARFVYSEILGLRYEVQFFQNIGEFSQSLKESQQVPDLLLADLRLEDEDFVSFLSKLEGTNRLSFPFFVVSSVDDLDMLRTCFVYGAADYLTKPFGKSELVVKLERFFSEKRGDSLSALLESEKKGATVALDPTTLTIRNNKGVSEALTSKEFQILASLFSVELKSLTKESLIKSVWRDVQVGSKTLDVHLFHLRRKLAPLNLEIKFLPPGKYLLSGEGMD